MESFGSGLLFLIILAGLIVMLIGGIKINMGEKKTLFYIGLGMFLIPFLFILIVGTLESSAN